MILFQSVLIIKSNYLGGTAGIVICSIQAPQENTMWLFYFDY